MAEAAGDGAEVDAGGDEFGGVVVAELVQSGVQVEALRHALEALGDGVRDERGGAVRGEGEEEGVLRDAGAELVGGLVLGGEVGAEDGQGVVVEGDAAALVGLGVLLMHGRSAAAEAGLDGEDAGVQVEVSAA